MWTSNITIKILSIILLCIIVQHGLNAVFTNQRALMRY